MAFDDIVLLMAEILYPISFASLREGDLSNLVSKSPHDGRAAWEYVDESHTQGPHGGSPRLRLVLNSHSRRLLTGVHRSWGLHLELGTNLIIDHFLQEEDWNAEVMAILHDARARLFCVGVFCNVAELELRESSRGDGGVEGRPLGLARRSAELCHAHQLCYDVTVETDQQTTAESVEAIVAALGASGLLASQ